MEQISDNDGIARASAEAKEWRVRIITIINQKGGCGKTTTAINLSAGLARGGLRTLLVDLDPQSHCAVGLGVPENRIDQDISDVLVAPPSRPLEQDRLLWRVARNLDLIPSRMKLAGLEASRGGLADKPDKERRLAQILERLKDQYDVAIIDCSPAIGLLTFNALAAAQLVLIPVETGFFSLQGATRQQSTVRTLAKRLGAEIPITFVATLHDEASTVSHDLLGELQRRFGHSLAPVTIRRDARIREAASFGQPAIEFAPNAPGSKDYLDLARFIAMKLSLRLSGAQSAAANESPAPASVSPTTNSSDSMLPGLQLIEAQPSITTPSGPFALSMTNAASGTSVGGVGLVEPSRPLDIFTAPQVSPAVPTASTPAAALAGGQPSAAVIAAGLASAASLRDALLGGESATPGATPLATTPSSETSPGAETTEPVRPTSRAAELVYRAQRLLKRVAGERLEEAPVRTTPLQFEASVEVKPDRGGEIDRRVLGVRQTSQGLLFVQPLSLGRKVSIAGTFNQWSTESHVLRRNDELGVFELCVAITPGTHQYRLVVDGQWTADPHNPRAELNPFGELNSVITVQSPAAQRMELVLQDQRASHSAA